MCWSRQQQHCPFFNTSTTLPTSFAAAALRLHGLPPVSCTHGTASAAPPAPLNRAKRKTLDIVQLVERTQQISAPTIRKSSRLVADTLLQALDDRIAKHKWQAAVKVFQLLREQEWYEPDVGTYIKLLSMLGKCKQPHLACRVFRTMLKEKCRPSVESYTALLTAFTRSNLLDTAFGILEEMKKVPDCQPDVFTYTELIKACSEALLFGHVDMLLLEMRRVGLRPNTVTYNILVDSYGKAGRFREMEDVFMEMKESDEIQPDIWTQNAILRNFSRAGNITAMEQWYMKLQSFGYGNDIITFNTLLNAYGKECYYEKLEHVRDFMHKYYYRGDTVTYNTIIDAYGRAGLIKEMKDAYREMRAMGVKENSHTFCSLIDAFGKKGVWTKVEKILRQMRNSNVEPDTAIFNAALDAYRRANRKVEMQKVLLEMEERGFEADKYTLAILSIATRGGNIQDSESMQASR